MKRHPIGQALTGLALLLTAGLVHAGAFSVNPVRVTLSAKQPVAALTLRNSGTEPTVVQLETVAWAQRDGEDVLDSSGDVLATPPIFTVPPGGTQIVRVGLRIKPPTAAETTFRLILREVPPAEPPKDGLRVALKISLPVFVVPAVSVAPKLAWRVYRASNGEIRVRATNTGNAHVQLTKLDLATADGGKAIGSRSLAQYVLPGSTREWTIPAKDTPLLGANLRVSTVSDAGALQSDVGFEADSPTLHAPGTQLAAQ